MLPVFGIYKNNNDTFPDSESDDDFNEPDESEDEEFTEKKFSKTKKEKVTKNEKTKPPPAFKEEKPPSKTPKSKTQAVGRFLRFITEDSFFAVQAGRAGCPLRTRLASQSLAPPDTLKCVFIDMCTMHISVCLWMLQYKCI